MNKKDLINEVCYTTNLTKKEIDIVLTAILEMIITKVSHGERVRLVGFGSFYKFKKKPTIKSPDTTDMSPKFKVKFSPGKFFKQKINVQN
uniref:DNA-binding protein hu homolog n=1 Tax=Cryptomonas curvata TaxID=233186 RepID=A0A679CA00_9CRYP|nr:DNA-binding protein hu homolog [Cryptomonas curvata]